MRRSIALVSAFCLVLHACGSTPSIGDYADEVEQLVATMNARIDELDAAIEGSNDLETAQWFATERVKARQIFLEGFEAVEPPPELTALRETTLVVMGRLTAAESALADRVLAMDTPVGLDEIWETPEGVAARAADEDAIALCEAAEEELDTSGERLGSEDAIWIPAEMREIVRVAFGCLAEDRRIEGSIVGP